MKTSYSQFGTMVDFMERHGDLSKPTGGPRGRQWCLKKWRELTAILNGDGTGDSKPEEKWRKVWADLKNNTKKKSAKISKCMRSTGGGPALKICLTDLEQRVIALMGVQAATGMDNIPEIGFPEEPLETQKTPQQEAAPEVSEDPTEYVVVVTAEEDSFDIPRVHSEQDETWNTPGGSQEPTREAPTKWSAPAKKKKMVAKGKADKTNDYLISYRVI